MTQTFNCGRKRVQQHQFAIEDEPRPEPDFEATDSDCEASSQDDFLFLESDSEHFYASDAEEAKPTAGSRKRAYAERRKDQIQILGKTVCWKAGARLLGIGQTTLNKLRAGEAIYTQKTRVKAPVHQEFGFAMRGDAAEKWPSIVMFLWYVYHSAAEFMPTPSSGHALKPRILQEAPFVEDRDPDDITRHVNSFMNSLEKYHSDIDVHLIGPGTFRGERRYLQHSSRSELYFEYVAYASSIGDNNPASHSTFLRVSGKVLGPHECSGLLKFRKPGEHAKCDTCTRLKKAMRVKRGRGTSEADKDSAIRAYSTHILSQWLDRQVYWSMRTLSQSWFRQQLNVGERHLGLD